MGLLRRDPRSAGPFGLSGGMGRRPRRLHKTRLVAKASWKTGAATVRHGVRWRRQLAPTYLTLALLTLGLLGRLVAGGGFLAGTWLLCCAIGLAWWQRRRQYRARHGGRRALLRWEIRYGWGLAAAAAFWLALAANLGPVPAVKAGLFGWWLAMQVPWAWRYRIRHVEPAEPAVDERLQIWDEDVAAPGGLAPGAALLDLTPVVDGAWEARVRTVRGKLTTTSLMGLQDNIGALFGAQAGNCVVEPAPSAQLDEARLTIVRRSPIREPVEYDESWMRIDQGCVPYTLYTDSAFGSLRVYLPMSGPQGELHSGDTGAGKSYGLNLAMTQSAQTGLVIPICGDWPKNGTSFPAWGGEQGLARWRAIQLPEMRRQARAIRELMYDRYRRMARWKWIDEDGDHLVGINFWDPNYVPWPIYEITWDEAQYPLRDPEIAEIMAEIATMVRAAGIRFRLAAPYPAAEELGGSVTIRQAVAAGATVAFRNNVRYSGAMTLPDYMPNPASIPATINGHTTKGTCVLFSSAPGSDRPAFSRVAFTKRATHWARIAAKRIPDEHPDDLAALGDVYATWRTRRERGEDGIEDEAPTVIDLASTTTATSPGPAGAASVTLAEQIVAFLTEHGPATSGTIAGHIDRPNGSVSRECSRLLKSGVLSGALYGAYSIPATDRELEGAAA